MKGKLVLENKMSVNLPFRYSNGSGGETCVALGAKKSTGMPYNSDGNKNRILDGLKAYLQIHLDAGRIVVRDYPYPKSDE